MTDTAPPQVKSAPPGPAPRPGPRLPLIPGPLETAVRLWRRLRRMSTALMLLFALALATLIATIIPQEPVIASTVRAWRDGSEGPGAGVSRVLDVLGLFDVFGSWWFAVLTGLLLISLTACLLPRYRVFWRNVRRPPARGTDLSRLSHRVHWPRPAGLTDAEVLTAAERVFRTYRTRRTVTPDGRAQLAVERGHWREFGSLVFHTSFYLLLIGVVLGSAFSFTGQIDIVEGGFFADTPLGYQSQTAGRFWGADDHDGTVTTIEDFEVTYLDGDNAFVPDEFVSTVTFTDPDGGDPVTEEIRVNHPAHFDGLTYYQRAFGFAPHLTLRSGLDGTELYDQQLILRTDESNMWTGRDKISQGSTDPDRPLPQIGIEVFFLPDAEITDDGGLVFNSPEPKNPRLLLTLYSDEDLGLDRAVPVSQLDWPEDAVVDAAMITPGQSVGLGSLGDGNYLFEAEFDNVAMWTGLQVSHQPFRWLILTAASLLLMGLIPSLYAYRRRLWVEVDDGRVTLSGVALQRKDRFDEEFETLTDRVGAAFGSRSTT